VVIVQPTARLSISVSEDLLGRERVAGATETRERADRSPRAVSGPYALSQRTINGSATRSRATRTRAIASRQIRRPARYRGGERNAREAGLALGVERDVLGS
jgi:hypothetical protein